MKRGVTWWDAKERAGSRRGARRLTRRPGREGRGMALWLAGIFLAVFTDLWGQWPQFRGPGGSGVGTGEIPVEFGPATNLLWRAALPAGHSSPCLAGGRLFITGFTNGELQTLALDPASGRELWRRSLPAGRIERGAQLSDPATATPASDGQSVVVYFGSFGLAAYDMEGREKWRKPLPVPVLQHGAGTSPVLAAGRVFLNGDQDVGSHLVAVDLRDGRTVWRVERPWARRGFATPLLWPQESPRQVILPGTLQMAAYDPATGALMWRVEGLPNEMVASAVADEEGTIFVAGWTHGSGVRAMPRFDELLAQGDGNGDGRLTREEAAAGPAKQHFVYIDADKDGLVTREEWEAIARIFDRSQNVAMAVRSDGRGEVTETHVVWRQGRGLPYVPTPLLYEGKLYLLKNGGLLTCLEASSGEVHFLEERVGAMGDYYASPVVAGGRILLCSQPGTVVVCRAGPVLEVLARNPIGEPILATPAVVAGRVYLRTPGQMWCFGRPTGGG